MLNQIRKIKFSEEGRQQVLVKSSDKNKFCSSRVSGENLTIFAILRFNIGRHSGRSSIVEDSRSLREITRDV